MTETLSNLAGSKKAVVLLAAMGLTAFSGQLSLDPSAIETIKWLTASYLGAQGLADFGKAAKGK